MAKKKHSGQVNGLEALGGIFTVNNGWEASAPEKKSFTIPKLKKPVVNNEEDSVSFQMKHVEQSKKPPEMNDQVRQPIKLVKSSVQEGKNEISQPNNFVKSNVQERTNHARQPITFNNCDVEENKSSDKFNFRRNSSDSSSSDEDEDDLNKSNSTMKRKSVFSESEDDGAEITPAAKDEDETLENPAILQKLSPEPENVPVVDNDGETHHDQNYEGDDDDAIDLLYNDEDFE